MHHIVHYCIDEYLIVVHRVAASIATILIVICLVRVVLLRPVLAIQVHIAIHTRTLAQPDIHYVLLHDAIPGDAHVLREHVDVGLM